MASNCFFFASHKSTALICLTQWQWQKRFAAWISQSDCFGETNDSRRGIDRVTLEAEDEDEEAEEEEE